MKIGILTTNRLGIIVEDHSLDFDITFKNLYKYCQKLKGPGKKITIFTTSDDTNILRNKVIYHKGVFNLKGNDKALLVSQYLGIQDKNKRYVTIAAVANN